MAKGQSHANRETKKPKKPKIPVAPPSVLPGTPPKSSTSLAEIKKK